MKVEKDEFSIDGGVCSDDDETTVSSRPFQTLAAATGKMHNSDDNLTSRTAYKELKNQVN